MFSDIANALYPSLPEALAWGAVGGVAGALLPRFVEKRTAAQPLEFALPEEVGVLAAVLSDVSLFPYASVIVPEYFAAYSHHAIWEALTAAVGPQGVPGKRATDADLELLGAQLSGRQSEILSQTFQALASSSAPQMNTERFRWLASPEAQSTPAPSSRDALISKLINDVDAVLFTGNERVFMGGTALVVEGTDPNSLDENNPPMVRQEVSPSPGRRVGTFLWLAGSFTVIPGAAELSGLFGFSGLLAGLAFALIAIFSTHIAMVDRTTMYVDVPIWQPAMAAVVALAVLIAGLEHDWGRLMPGIFAGLSVFGFIAMSSLIHKRGIHFGDTLIFGLSLVGPTLITASGTYAIWNIMFAFIALLGFFAFDLAVGRTKLKRNNPYPFGPPAAAAWPFALLWLAWAATTLNFLA